MAARTAFLAATFPTAVPGLSLLSAATPAFAQSNPRTRGGPTGDSDRLDDAWDDRRETEGSLFTASHVVELTSLADQTAVSARAIRCRWTGTPSARRRTSGRPSREDPLRRAE